MAAFQDIAPMLWLDHQAEEAASFYVSLFRNARITETTRTGAETPSGNEVGSVLTVSFELEGLPITALNGGSYFKLNSAISLLVSGSTREEVESLYAQLSEGGNVLMPLAAYPFSELFGYVQDRYGVAWQINLGERAQKVTPFFMFCGPHDGQAEAAVNRYTSLFDGGRILEIQRFTSADEGGTPGHVKFAAFRLGNREFIAMDGGPDHEFTFNEAFSLVITCETQDEMDALWAVLSAHPESEQCGWCKDEFGVSWQVTPSELFTMMADPDPEKTRRVTEAFMPMHKLDLAELRKAYEGV